MVNPTIQCLPRSKDGLILLPLIAVGLHLILPIKLHLQLQLLFHLPGGLTHEKKLASMN
jgi:hypothetical protein